MVSKGILRSESDMEDLLPTRFQGVASYGHSFAGNSRIHEHISSCPKRKENFSKFSCKNLSDFSCLRVSC